MPHSFSRPLLLLSLFICSTVLFSCREKHTPWDAGTPESNRLMVQFDSIANFSKQFRDTVAMAELADRMAVLGRTDSLSKARWYYMQHDIAYNCQNDSLALLYARLGREMLDSATYPYETARFIYGTSFYGKTASQKYMRVAGPLRVFEEYGDSINIASANMSLGALLAVMKDYKTALVHTQKSHDMYQRLGEKRAAYRLKRNIVHIFINLDRKEEAFNLAMKMREDSCFGTDNAVDCLVLSNIYDSTRNVALLREGLEIACKLSKRIPEWHTPVPYISAKLGRYYIEKGMLDSAEYYLPPVLRALDDGRNTYDDMYLFKAEMAEAKGDTAMARATRTQLAGLQSEERKSMQIAEAENKMELESIHRFNNTLEKEKASISVKALCLLALAVALASLAAWGTVRLVRRRSARRISELNDDLSRSSSELAVAHLRNAEKERVLSQALADVREIKKDPTDARSKSTKIVSDISRAYDSDSDWEKFEITFEQANAQFITSLRERNPALTKGDVRLACMIAMGMDNKHISRVLAINVDSVKKNRQRLRAKLQLDADTTLPEFLASIKQEQG